MGNSDRNTGTRAYRGVSSRKEKVIKDILSLRDGLRGLMVRLSEVEEENDKLAKENETLSLYVENLYVEALQS